MCPSRFSALSASPSEVDVWIADAAATGGGFRLTLNSAGPVTAGGHSYRFSNSDALFGTGSVDGVSMVVTGYVELSVDGQAAQIRFDVNGCGQQGMPPGQFAAQVKRTRGASSETVLRAYSVTMPGSGATYQLTNVQAPSGCAVGVDLMGIKFP
jgi:hypothetical protein